ncbi:fumarylacetoacetate hydrolase family protein [Streptomyces sp. INA 01156]
MSPRAIPSARTICRTACSLPGSTEQRVGVRLGDHVLDAGAAAHALGSPYASLLARPTLNPLLAAGRTAWSDVRRALTAWVTVPAHRETVGPLFHPLSSVTLHLPFDVADYVDFYASENHARNVGRIFRRRGRLPHPELEAPADRLPRPFRHGGGVRHGRRTALGAAQGADRPGPGLRPVGPAGHRGRGRLRGRAPSERGRPVPLGDFRDHVFGLCLLNDWSARDVQAWEYVPSARSSASPSPPRCRPGSPPGRPGRGPGGATAAHARAAAVPGRHGRGTRRLRPADLRGRQRPRRLRAPFSTMYWTAAQQLAHMTVNGASLRTGDLYGSGTVSGPTERERGSLLELTWNGRDALELPDGKRTFLEDGDVVTLSAWAPGPDGVRVGLGEVTGRVTPAG